MVCLSRYIYVDRDLQRGLEGKSKVLTTFQIAGEAVDIIAAVDRQKCFSVSAYSSHWLAGKRKRRGIWNMGTSENTRDESGRERKREQTSNKCHGMDQLMEAEGGGCGGLSPEQSHADKRDVEL